MLPGGSVTEPVIGRSIQSNPLQVSVVTDGDTESSASGSIDGFFRNRVSLPQTLLTSSMENDEQPLLWHTEETAGGTSTYVPNESRCDLAVTGSGDSVWRQTYQYARYQPGKSLMLLMTYAFGAVVTGVTKRVGYFDANNGVFLEQTDSDYAFVIRKNGSDTRVTSGSWSLLPNPSYSDGDAKILVVDIAWLGVGAVRCGFIDDGAFNYVHSFINAGVDTVYFKQATLPCRYEISSTDGASTLRQICCTVLSEGGYVPRGYIRAGGTGPASRSLSNSAMTPVMALRLKTGYAHATVLPQVLNFLNDTGGGNDIYFALIYKIDSLTGGSWSSVSEACEINITATAYTGGYVITSGYATKETPVTIDIDDMNLVNSSEPDGTSHIMIIGAQALSGSPDGACELTWREIF